MLAREELNRYNRQIILPEIGMQGQENLKNARVLVIGAGGLGCPVLQYLAAAGVGTIGIVDNDMVDLSNLQRQILYTTNDIGRPKAIIAKEKLMLLNPHISIIAHNERLTSVNAETITKQYDFVIDGSDNFPTRYLVNDTCVALNKALVFGSIFKFEGHVSVFNYKAGPAYRDIFPEAPPDGEVPNCDEIGVLGIVPGIIGAYMANEAIKIICGIGETLSGKLMTINALDNSVSVFKVAKQNQNNHKASPTSTEQPVEKISNEISMEQLTAWLRQIPGEVCLVDVREPYEYEEHNIGGINIPLYELTQQADALPGNKKLVFCCQSGQRSKIAIHLLKDIYKGEMYNLKNGIF
jgi:molybdopterin/thiamine biosynthesis adenylyltransferase/rhodanese-related sulfurtransferase